GMILADNGSAWYISGAPDSRWDNNALHTLGGVLGSDFEAVDGRALMINANSGQALQNSITVSVTPPSATVRAGKSQSFTAAVTGTSNTAVTWSVNGVAGGNGTVGFVTSAGAYTAPGVVPSPATVQVQATSAASASSFGTATVTIIPQPTIASVSPSPITA